ncbi:hypothetical protein SAMN05518801_111114 [Novosphingobium sp. CF614]|uniref:hypothetical protein n=1 Tax=Novosphingobium sp. CF614 TaxID=1884364 RepID=UPI0008EBB985|nr:hypothetical protein [Novosphingobium sp. CF614]SFG23818.1 hypothetical protein SAMN05518801_111114 [Novosphingobium sp. CF614]
MPRRPTAAALVASGLLLAGLALTAMPAAAQDEAGSPDGEKVNQLIVYGEDPCPASAEGEITVCARKPEEERYRIPAPLRGIDSPKADAWTNKVQAYETVGAFGTLSCSPVGAGGSLGCTQQLIDRAYAEKKNGSDVKFSELIAAERQKRLSAIDTDAAAQQQRVEEAEKAYFEQQKRQQAEQDAAEDASAKATVEAPLPVPQ